MSPENVNPTTGQALKGRQKRCGPTMTLSIAPLGLQCFFRCLPRADARGYCLTLLRSFELAPPTFNGRTQSQKKDLTLEASPGCILDCQDRVGQKVNLARGGNVLRLSTPSEGVKWQEAKA